MKPKRAPLLKHSGKNLVVWRVPHKLLVLNFWRWLPNFLDLATAIYFPVGLGDYKLSANIPFTHKDVGLALPHPVLAIADFIKCLDSNDKLKLLFMGNTPKQFEDLLAYMEKTAKSTSNLCRPRFTSGSVRCL